MRYLGLVCLIFLFSCAPRTNTVLWQETVISEALLTLNNLLIEKERGKRVRDFLENAKGIYIETSKTAVGLVLGVEGGRGLFLVKGKNGRWSSPAFMNSGGLSLGLQIGVMNERSLTLYLTNKSLLTVVDGNAFSGGLGVRGAFMDRGESATSAVSPTTENDVVVFGEGSGVYVGASATGRVLTFNRDLNNKFYGTDDTTLEGILLDGRAVNPSAQPLLDRLNSLTGE